MPKKRKAIPPPLPEHEEVDLSVMHQIIPCRERQINDIYTLMGEPWQHTVPSIFVYGHASCGKSLVLENLLSCLEVRLNSIFHVCNVRRLSYSAIMAATAEGGLVEVLRLITFPTQPSSLTQA